MADTFPLTPAQELVLAGQMLAPGEPLYNMGWRFDLRVALDPERFAQAVGDVARRRDVLGLRIVRAAGGSMQFIGTPPAMLPPLDLTGEADPERAARDWMAERIRLPFDLEASVWEARLLQLGRAHWVWYLCQHHVAADAASGAAFFRVVAAAYEGKVPLEASAWRDLARGDAAPLEVDMRGHAAPYGGHRSLGDAASLRVEIPFGTERAAALERLAKEPGFRAISPDLSRLAIFATIEAAWLHRATGDTRLVLGIPAHMRLSPQDREAIGLLMETLPLVVDIEPQDSFRALHRRVLAGLIDLLRKARRGAVTADIASAIRSTVNYLPFDPGEFAGVAAEAEWLHSGAHDAGHDLQLSILRPGSGYTVEARLNRKVFAGYEADFAAHWLRMADAMLAEPDATVGAVALGGHVLEGKPTPPARPVLARFAEIVAARPDAVAVEEPGRSLSYRELDRRASEWAEGCRAAGVARGDPVLVSMGRGVELLAAILGVMRAGGVFVPQPLSAPDARLAALAERNAIRFACLDRARAGLGCKLIAPMGLGSEFEPPARDDPAYAIFTSGSTGEPKGVLVSHRGLADYIEWAAREHPGDHALHSSIGFDLTITSLFAPLVTGHRIIAYPETGVPDLAVLDAFREDRVDVVKLTPAHLSLVVEAGLHVRRISRLILGGEALTVALADRARAAGLSVTNEYGPTEAVVGAMLHEYDPRTDRGATVSIGKPADGVTIAVLDAGGNPVPPGIPGEIFIGGRLAAGYLGRPDLTSERFVTKSGQRLYRSGDLARIGKDGRVAYLGRADDQVKLSGVRIEPAEIAAVLEKLPGVARVHVGLSEPRPAFDAGAPACTVCGLSAQVPGADLDTQGICATCRELETYRERAHAYFDSEAALGRIVSELRARRRGRHDAVMLLSGGKDSTYALHRLAELTPNILCLTLDNGFLSEEAKANIRNVAEGLGLDHRFMTTPAMNAIFRDSLARHSNVCQGCFKTIYTLAIRVARDEGIPAIVTGLSRGQFFETRLTPELFLTGSPSRHEIEATVTEARRSYHGMDDAVARHLDTRDLADPAIFDEIRFIDIYRYLDVPVAEIYRYLDAKGWQRPKDTGRSTNCRINDLGIHVHTRREGFHNYAIPYAWDVRMGVKTRAEAVAELHDDIDPERIAELVAEIGLDPAAAAPRKAQLVAWVEGNASMADMLAALRGALPREMQPAHVVPVASLPLTGNGKVDTARLPHPGAAQAEGEYVPPAPGPESVLASVIAEIIGAPRVGQPTISTISAATVWAR